MLYTCVEIKPCRHFYNSEFYSNYSHQLSTVNNSLIRNYGKHKIFHPRRPVAIIGDIYGTECNVRRICCLTTRSLTIRLAIVANIKSVTLGTVMMRPVVTDLTLDPTFAGSAASEWLAAWPLVVVFRSNGSEPCFITVPDACRDEPTIHKQLPVLSKEHSHIFFIKPFHTCNASCNRSSDG